MKNLFEHSFNDHLRRSAPLAERMRPRTLEDFEEQYGVIGAGTPLRRAVENDTLSSVILHGPPGTGKTTLARVIAGMTKSHFETINAVMAGVADIRRVVEEARERLTLYREGTVLFIDEIHRFNKAQQDALLPFVESGLVTLIGSTTENPLFTVNRPLLSRSRLYRLEPLSREALVRVMRRALNDTERGLGNYRADMEDGVLEYMAGVANGDARAALNCLELSVMTTPPGEDGVRRIGKELAVEACGGRVLQFNREDEHYDAVSAFIKSMRGTDPQATLYWLARMIYAGDDPEFICRRIMIHAAEDVGLADPRAIMVAVAAAQAVERVGMPEGRIIMAEAALYVALAPKSNSVVMGINAALKTVRDEQATAVPRHLRDGSFFKLERIAGNKTVNEYKYPHDFPGHYVKQEYLPENVVGSEFYTPSASGEEKEIRLLLEKLKKYGK
ncbi:MAG: ATPase AAA [Peptococcaceae bacterium BRH_c4b]|nr:MAG: ATPase AAA [Peptococcaceae bacterium BRH_c4b]